MVWSSKARPAADGDIEPVGHSNTVLVRPKGVAVPPSGRSTNDVNAYGSPGYAEFGMNEGDGGETTVEALANRKKGWFAYVRTKDFWIVLVLGYVPFGNTSEPFHEAN